jgi:hypothetical protein
MARLSLSGLGSRPRIETAYGSAELSQTIGLVEVGSAFRNGKRLRPMVSVGAGLLKVSMAGVGKPPYEGREGHQRSAVFDAGVGGALALRSRVALIAELHTFLASPHPEVRSCCWRCRSSYEARLLVCGKVVTASHQTGLTPSPPTPRG